MNMEMMILCDCVSSKASTDEKSHLFKYISSLSEICEVKAMAWRDLQNYTEQATNNLYFAFAAMTNKSLKFDEPLATS